MELLDKKETAIAAYQPFYADLAKLEADNASITFDYESKKGNTEARSHVYKLRQSKSALERTRKSEKAEFLRLGKAVDSEAAALAQRIEAMIKVHQDAIDAIEKREADRIYQIKTWIEGIRQVGACAETASMIQGVITTLEGTPIGDEYEEFKAEALEVKDAQLQTLRLRRDDVAKKEAEAAELTKLREEAAARAQADRDAAIAKAAEERAKAEADQRAAQVAAAQQKAIQDAENKAKAEREAGERRELELKLAAENAERRRVEQEQRAEQDRQASIARAEQQAREAVEDEKRRVAAVAAQAAKEQAAREANKAHKTKINRAALAALVEGGLSEECAKQCVTLIASGKVPSITIAY